jgi:lysophospholipase L1-like esterase
VCIVITLLPFGGFVGLPLLWLATWTHEAAHGAAALISGGEVVSIEVFTDGSGVARTLQGGGTLQAVFVASAGYVGAALVAGALIVAGRWSRLVGPALLVVGAGMVLSAILAGGAGRWIILLIGVALGALAFTPIGVRSVALDVVAVMMGVNAFKGLWVLFGPQGAVNGEPANSDAEAVAALWFGPSFIWAVLWTILAVVIMAAAVWLRVRGGERPAPPARPALTGGLALALVVAAGLGSGPQAAAAPALVGAPVIGSPVLATRTDGRVVVDVPVRWAGVRSGELARVDRRRARLDGELYVAVPGLGAARARSALWLTTGARQPRLVHRVVLPEGLGERVAERSRRGPIALRLSARAELRPGGTGRAASVVVARRAAVAPLLPRAPLPPPARCQTDAVPAQYGRAVGVQVACPGAAAPRITGAARGRVSRASSPHPGRASALYRPPPRYAGPDRLRLDTGRAGGRTDAATVAVPLTVPPFTLRAIGDSVTAGFGYLGDGTPWGPTALPSCFPTTPPNNRCSSNSSNGIGSTGPVGWSPDFGLGNGIAWPARFANDSRIGGPGAFQNLAVTGSAPVDWASGYLNPTLRQLVAGSPDLVVLTLGANPLLDEFLFGSGLECAVTFSDAELIACVNGIMAQQQIGPRLRSVLSQLLAAPYARVVVSTYHLTVPSTTVFSPHQIGLIIDTINAQVTATVQGVPGFGTRVFLMSPPRFDVGVPPGDDICVGATLSQPVDGPSRQARISQDALALNPFRPFCGSTDYWIVSSDTGIHPSRDGHAQFAAALARVAQENALVPPPPLT